MGAEAGALGWLQVLEESAPLGRQLFSPATPACVPAASSWFLLMAGALPQSLMPRPSSFLQTDLVFVQ